MESLLLVRSTTVLGVITQLISEAQISNLQQPISRLS